MKRTAVVALVVALIFAVTALAFAAVSDPNATKGKRPARTLENIHKGHQAIKQEFVWDEASGTFQTVNLYTTGEYVDEGDATAGNILSTGAAGEGDLVGDAKNYTYWDGSQWVTLDDITRYEGKDDRAEAFISRYDVTHLVDSWTTWQAVTGTQTLYSYSSYSRVVRHDPHYHTYWYTNSYSTGEREQTGTFSSVDRVPGAFDPVVEVTLANGWKITIRSDYQQWGNEVQIQEPGSKGEPGMGRVTHVYGDPHMIQAGGTQQQELAAVGNYVFDLGGYTLDLACLKSNAGFSLVTDLSITGPNDYQMTYGRNNEVKVEGGTP